LVSAETKSISADIPDRPQRFHRSGTPLWQKTPAILFVLPDSAPEAKSFPPKLMETGDNRQ